jgi:tRNA(Ile)-lysidine synthase
MRLPPSPAADGDAVHCVAFSGGGDSTVLLHLAAVARLPGLRAIHVHHGLQPLADDWAEHCARVCAALAVPLTVRRVPVDTDDPQGLEAAARKARYAALRECLPAGAVLMTAHHQSDQAETVLFRLLRGTGVDGLAAMRTLAPFGDGWLWRPLLQVPSSQLRAYQAQHALIAVDDPHNTDPRYARSWLRHTLLPQLRQHWPAAERHLAEAACHAQEASQLLTTLAEQKLASLRGPDDTLCAEGLRRLSAAEQALVLRHWCDSRRLARPSQAQLDSLLRQVGSLKPDTDLLVAWPGVECRAWRQRLYASAPLPPPPVDFSMAWDGRTPLVLPAGCGVIEPLDRHEHAYAVRFARGGDRIRLAGRTQHQCFKQLAQAAGLPPWIRQRMPVLLDGAQLLSIAGWWNAAEAPVLSWQPTPLPGLPKPPCFAPP